MFFASPMVISSERWANVHVFLYLLHIILQTNNTSSVNSLKKIIFLSSQLLDWYSKQHLFHIKMTSALDSTANIFHHLIHCYWHHVSYNVVELQMNSNWITNTTEYCSFHRCIRIVHWNTVGMLKHSKNHRFFSRECNGTMSCMSHQ